MPFKPVNRHRQLFFIFCKISLFTVGGGLAMLPLVRRELVERKQWVKDQEFLDIFAVAQSFPGVMILNVATAVGYKLAGFRGAMGAAFGAVVPPFIVIVALASVLFSLKDMSIAERVLNGIRPAVIALIAAAVANLAGAAHINRRSIAVPLAVIAAIVFFGIGPVYVILAGMLVNLIFVYVRMRTR